MATYNPRAGMPPRKKYDVKPGGGGVGTNPSKSWLEKTVERIMALPDPSVPMTVRMEDYGAVDANALRSWLLGYMDSIGDQLPDLAQWRRIREEVGRSVAVKEAVKETAVPVKKVDPLDEAIASLEGFTMPRYEVAEVPPTGIWKPAYFTWTKDGEGNITSVNLCGND